MKTRQSSSGAVAGLVCSIQASCRMESGAVECDPTQDRYRTLDGTCNNLASKEWGAAGTRLRWFAPAAYSDGGNGNDGHISEDCKAGVSEPRAVLAEPRLVSNVLHSKSGGPADTTSPDSDFKDDNVTHMVMQFGQFLDHDITLTPQQGFAERFSLLSVNSICRAI